MEIRHGALEIDVECRLQDQPDLSLYWHKTIKGCQCRLLGLRFHSNNPSHLGDITWIHSHRSIQTIRKYCL